MPAVAWHTTTVGGARTRWLDSGTGDPLLFLHGWGMTPRVYARAITPLTRAGIRVIAPALPGFGGSSGVSPLGLTIDAYAARVAEFVDALDLGSPAFVMGHSLGGGVAIRLAATRPDLVRSLTLVNSVGGAPSGRSGMSARPVARVPHRRCSAGSASAPARGARKRAGSPRRRRTSAP